MEHLTLEGSKRHPCLISKLSQLAQILEVENRHPQTGSTTGRHIGGLEEILEVFLPVGSYAIRSTPTIYSIYTVWMGSIVQHSGASFR